MWRLQNACSAPATTGARGVGVFLYDGADSNGYALMMLMLGAERNFGMVVVVWGKRALVVVAGRAANERSAIIKQPFVVFV